MERSGGEQDHSDGDAGSPDADSGCIIGRTLLFPGKRLLVEVVDGVDGIPIVGRVAGIGPKGAVAAAEAAKALGGRLVGAEAAEPPEARPDA